MPYSFPWSMELPPINSIYYALKRNSCWLYIDRYCSEKAYEVCRYSQKGVLETCNPQTTGLENIGCVACCKNVFNGPWREIPTKVTGTNHRKEPIYKSHCRNYTNLYINGKIFPIYIFPTYIFHTYIYIYIPNIYISHISMTMTYIHTTFVSMNI